MGSRGRQDEPESGPIQPDSINAALGVVALVKHSPPHPLNILLLSKMLYFYLSFTGLTLIPAFFELSEFFVTHLDSPAELFLI